MTRILHVALRDFVATVATKGFIFGLLVMPAILGAFVIVGPRIFDDDAYRIAGEYAVIDPTGVVLPEMRAALDPEAVARRRLEAFRRSLDEAPETVRSMAETASAESIDEALGPARDELTLLPPFAGRTEGTTIRGTVIHVDRYGNLVTTIRKEQLPPDFTLDINAHTIERMVRTFSDASPGALACHVDSSGVLAIAEREGNAAARTGAARGDAVVLTPR